MLAVKGGIAGALLAAAFISAPTNVMAQPTSGGSIVIKQGTGVTDADRKMLVEVFTGVQRQKSMMGRFVQTDSKARDPSVGLTGRFAFERPGKLLFEYDPPNQLRIVSNGSRLLLADGKRDTKKYYPLRQTPLRFLTENPIDMAYGPGVLGVTNRNGKISVRMRQESIFGTNEITVDFRASTFEMLGWITNDKGRLITVALHDTVFGSDLDRKLFHVD